jgi:hypothetical protein
MKTTTTPAARLATLSVLAGAYANRKSTLLTHTVNLDTDAVLCTRVNPDHMADIYSATGDEADAAPTCKTCRARDPRF